MVHLIAGLIAFAVAVALEFILNLPFVITAGIGVVGLAAFESIYAALKKK